MSPYYIMLRQGFDNDIVNCQSVCQDNSLCVAYYFEELTAVGQAAESYSTKCAIYREITSSLVNVNRQTSAVDNSNGYYIMASTFWKPVGT